MKIIYPSRLSCPRPMIKLSEDSDFFVSRYDVKSLKGKHPLSFRFPTTSLFDYNGNLAAIAINCPTGDPSHGKRQDQYEIVQDLEPNSVDKITFGKKEDGITPEGLFCAQYPVYFDDQRVGEIVGRYGKWVFDSPLFFGQLEEEMRSTNKYQLEKDIRSRWGKSKG